MGECKGRGRSYRILEQYLSCTLEVFVYLSGALTGEWALGGNDLVWGPKVSLAFSLGFDWSRLAVDSM